METSDKLERQELHLVEAVNIIPKTSESSKWLLGYAASGGLAIILSLWTVWSMLQEAKASRQFFQTQFVQEMKESAKSNAQAAQALEDAADAMKDSVDSQERVYDSVERMSHTQEMLSKAITDFIERLEEKEKEGSRNGTTTRANNP